MGCALAVGFVSGAAAASPLIIGDRWFSLLLMGTVGLLDYRTAMVQLVSAETWNGIYVRDKFKAHTDFIEEEQTEVEVPCLQ